jgi:hypothetical protein
MFIYAWTLKPEITWVAPFIGLVVRLHLEMLIEERSQRYSQVFIFASFTIYLAVFVYLADV